MSPRAARPSIAAALVGAAALLVLAACSRSTAPARPDFRGTYALIANGGSALPYTIAVSTTYTDREIADTLIIDGAGGASASRVIRRDFSDGSPPQLTRLTSAAGYTVRADTIYFCAGYPTQLGVCGEGWFGKNGLLDVGPVGAGGQANPMYLRLYKRISQYLAARD